ncbi:hypothetical protein MPTK1_6g11600 [Marchantia polymorpha subsp. ruderalis]|uniref:Uncharacterized protein n=2 Tax=Marchantia polymorpha TaxID=3197 RepID=A0AAF6BQZ1_MARPO|nr:hypothetical protein MARPO_0016s0199 [Marchantia polymorpha]BBN14425.1 hypothetical protein Mp_6g11600 [Marchantia polymorpha subsp. ruderalis]|eukprot:PTQ45159.1 hypothetical protein MARPO_0016s0199 [Marchantia polymorpha]
MASNNARPNCTCEDREAHKDISRGFLYMVKLSLRDEDVKFRKFLKLLSDWKAAQITIIEVVVEVKSMFKDHPQILNGFREFLPREFANLIPKVEYYADQ